MGDKFLGLFIEKTFYNELFNKLKSYIYLHRDEIKVRFYTLSLISYKALDDFTVKEWKIHSCLEKKLYKRPSGYRKNAKELSGIKLRMNKVLSKILLLKR